MPTKRWMDPEDAVYMCAMGWYSVINKNEILLFAAAWMGLEMISLSEVIRQRETALLKRVAKSQMWLTDWNELDWWYHVYVKSGKKR